MAQKKDAKVDHDSFYIIDKRIPRHVLGSGVHSYKFYVAGNTSVRVSSQPAAAREPTVVASQPSAVLTQQPRADPPAQPTRAVPAAATPSQPSAAATPQLQVVAANLRNMKPLKRHVSPDDELLEDPSATRRRVLSETMNSLRFSICAAAADKRLHNPSDWARDAVGFHAGEMFSALGELRTDEQNRKQPQTISMALIDKASAFVAKQLLQHASVADLRKMQPLLAKMASMNATQFPVINILTRIAVFDEDDATCVTFEDIDVVERNILWEKFSQCIVNAKRELAIELSQQRAADGQPSAADVQQSAANDQPSAADGQRSAERGSWKKHVENALHIRPVSEGLAVIAKTILAVFD